MDASNITTNPDTKTYARCQRKPIPAALLCPFSAGEIISHTSVIKIEGDVPAPLAFRPFGELTMAGKVARALPAVLAWINPEATVTNTDWSWRDAIGEQLLRGETVNIDELPAGVLLNSPAKAS